MKHLRSLYASLFLFITMFFSISTAQAAEITIPSYGTFGGASVDGDTFNWSSTASGYQSWGGFAATNDGGGEAYLPFIFSADGQLTVNAAVESGESATLRFVFENAPHPNNTPNFEVSIPISGSTIQTYTATLPAQGDQTFSNFVFYITEADTPVQIQDIQVVYDDPVIDPNAPTPGASGETTITAWGAFEGASNEEGVFNFPAAAQSYAGFANDDASAYPFTFSEAGQITFTASVPEGGSDTTVYFKFEKNPYPDVNPNFSTEQVIVSGSTPTEYTVALPAQGDQTFSSFLFYIIERDSPVILGDVTVFDDEGAATVISNGVRFVFEEISGGSAAYTHNTETVEITNTDPQSYSITIPAYSDPAATFENMLLYAIGADQPITVTDVTLNVGGVTYGGSGEDSLVFSNSFGGVSIDDATKTYTFLSTSQSWGGFALSNDQVAEFPTNGLVFDQEATLTFTANWADTTVTLPPVYNGETAFSNGIIDTDEDVGTGRDDDPAYKWSAYVSWFTLEAGDTKGTFAGQDSWSQLSDLPATWENGVITLMPNTASYDTWSEEGSDDGIHYLEQTLKIEGTQNTSEILGKTVNFSGTVDSYTLDPRYTVTAFIKYTDPNNNYVTVGIDQVTLSAAGDFAVSLDIPTGDYIPQLGLLLEGRNANPATDWGNIQVSNLVGTYDETTSIKEGNFTNGSNAYWGFVAGVDFNTNGGNGPIPGQVVMTNAGTDRNSVYIASNQGNYETIDQLGMEAGTTYDVSYYMNRISGTDLGLVQFAFYVADTQTWVYVPADTSAVIHADANPTNGEWVQYTQSIEVPVGTTFALLYLISGAESVIAFDQISVSEAVVANTFENWASDNGLSGANAGFSADPDNDGIPNGLESFLGTLPGSRSGGMSSIAKTSNGVSMQHSKNSDLSDDVSASYLWSKDLTTWSNSGDTVDGTTVTIAAEDNSPSEGTTTATATVSGTDSDTVFIRVSVTNE
ncbi:MAG: hypothetical protein P8I61_06110 [Opitutae bacterium]|nr:hypothetical protein [Opitutae bacterium]